MIYPAAESMQLLAEKKIDALIGVPPVPQELREKKIGHVIVNSRLDRPWSQYSGHIPAAHRKLSEHPMATKRALRAIVKAANFCAAEPERAARMVADKGYRYDYSLQMMNEIQYTRWRDYDAEDTVRFYSLRLRGGHDQIQPQQDHCGRHELALSSDLGSSYSHGPSRRGEANRRTDDSAPGAALRVAPAVPRRLPLLLYVELLSDSFRCRSRQRSNGWGR